MLTLRAKVPNLNEADFGRLAGEAEKNCPVSKVLNATITLDAKLTYFCSGGGRASLCYELPKRTLQIPSLEPLAEEKDQGISVKRVRVEDAVARLFCAGPNRSSAPPRS